MYPAQALSEQQVMTLYVVGTFLTLFPIALCVAGLLGILHRKVESEV